MTPDRSGLSGRPVLITGGARGLGREMALALSAAGARLAIAASGDSPALHRTADDCAAAGAREVIALWGDVADAEVAARLVAETETAFGRLDVLVNNAGRGMRLVSETFNTEPTRFWEADPAAWRRITEINTLGPFHLARAAVPGMVARGFGKVVNVSTSDRTMVRRGYAPYGPTKAYLEAASRIWAQDLEGTGVDVNVLLPGGAADTDLLPPAPDRKGADGMLLDPAVMQAPILWLASDASNGVTGGRFVARLWDGPEAARDDTGAPPRLM
ncbi:SDR family oxidoreductase [Rhodobacteraceae bacterium CCMM004]|nr:SDR family oxidoreductase [Rhodobacteraceae bacterium CCMM004]